MAPSLKKMWGLLESSTARDRQEGITMLRSTFGVQRNLVQLSRHARTAKAEGKIDFFLRTITALTTCVTAEKETALRKHTRWQDASSVTLSRLRESANAVRWLVEQAGTYFNQACLQTLLMHIITLANDRGNLLEPIALDYTKALSALLSHPPHVQHIAADHWSLIVSFCFNALLGDKLSTPLPVDVSDEDWQQASLLSKKSTSGATAAAAAAGSRFGPAGARREAGPEILCLTSSICSLVCSKSAPMLNDKRGVGVLYKLAAFFELFPNPSSAHADALRSVNAALLDLHLNERKTTMAFVHRVWHAVIPHLPTRLKALKEQVVAFAVVALPIISTPYLGAPNNEIADAAEGTRKIEAVKRLHQLLLAESQNRGGVDVLGLDTLQLVISDEKENGQMTHTPSAPFQLKIARPVRTWTAANTLSWATLQLLADTTVHLAHWVTDTAPAQNGVVEDGQAEMGRVSPLKHSPSMDRLSPSKQLPSSAIVSPEHSPRKRRKIDHNSSHQSIAVTLTQSSPSYDALTSVLDEIDVKQGDTGGTAVNRRVWALQSIIFLVERHWHTLDEPGRRDVLIALHAQLDLPVDRAYPSLLLALAACALAEGQTDVGQRTLVLPEYWAQVWTEALRKVVVPTTCRSAAHVACALLYQKAPLLNTQKMLASLKLFLQNLNQEAPSVLVDSTCALMREALRHATGDVVLAQANLEFRVLDWVNRSWSALSGSSRRSKMQLSFEELDTVDLTLLLIRICKLRQQGTLIRPDPILENCDLLNCLRTMAMLRTAREFLFEAKFPDAGPELEEDDEWEGVKFYKAHHALLPIQRRCYDIMLQSATDLFAQIAPEKSDDIAQSGHIESIIPTLTVEDVMRVLHFSTTALAFDSSLKIADVQTLNTLHPMAERLFVEVLRIWKEPRWKTEHLLLLLQTLRPLLPPPCPSLSEQGTRWISHILTEPGKHSGVARHLQRRSRKVPRIPPARLLPVLWNSATLKTSEVLEIVQSVLVGLTSATVKKAISGEGEKLSAFDNDDDNLLNEAPEVEETATLPDEMKIAFESGIALCVEALSILPFFARLDANRETETWLVDRMLQVPDAFFTSVTSVVLDAVAAGRLTLTEDEADQVLHRLGSELLTSYEHGRNPDVQIIGASFVQATTCIWGDYALEEEDNLRLFCDNVIEFLEFMTKQSMRIRSWRVRLHLVCVFDDFLAHDSRQDTCKFFSTDSPRPRTALINFAQDVDFTVRFAAARAHALLLKRHEGMSTGNDPGSKVTAIYCEIRTLMTKDFTWFESVATLLLYAANVIISSSSTRGLAISNVAELTWDAKHHRVLVRNTLDQVASKLGFKSLKDFYRGFAANVTFEFMKADADPSNLDVGMLGYDEPQDYFKSLLPELGSTMLLYTSSTGQTHFNALAKRIEMSPSQALAACFPRVAAQRLVWSIEDLHKEGEGPTTYEDAWKRARDQIALDMRIEAAGVSERLSQYFYDIVAEILNLFYEAKSLTDYGDFMLDMREFDQDVATRLTGLTADLRAPQSWDMHQPYGIHANGLMIYGALTTLNIALTNENMPAAEPFSEREVYNPIQMILETISQDHFLNDQLRHLDALKLWIAFNYDTIVESAVLHRAIFHGAALAVQRLELAHSASGIVIWAISVVKNHVIPASMQQAGDMLLAAQAAVRFAQEQDDDNIRTFGKEFVKRLEADLIALLEITASRPKMLSVLCSWPRRLSGKLAELMDAITLDETRQALKQRHSPSVEAHHLEPVIAKLKGLSTANDSVREEFAAHDFWHLLLKIGGSQLEQRRDNVTSLSALGDSIADLTYALQGRLRAPSLRALQEQSELTLFPVAGKPVRFAPAQESGRPTLKERVLSYLLQELDSGNNARMSAAYRTLRRLKVADANLERFRGKAHDEGSAELTDIAPDAQYETKDLPRVGRNYPPPESSLKFEAWVTQMAATTLYNIAVYAQDSLLFQCVSIAAEDIQHASDLLPIAAASIVAAQRAGELPNDVANPMAIHFHQVLSSDAADKKCWSMIVKCLLNIRANSRSANFFGYHFDLLLVGRRALQCKLYSTALMFIELSLDPPYVRSRTGTQNGEKGPPAILPGIPPHVAALLDEIYANIEDPDGFYGIPVTDVQDAYARQLEHEGEWRRAFDVHATRLEATLQSQGSSGPLRGLTPVTNSLHQLSYNSLASMLNQHTASMDGTGNSGPDAHAQNLTFDVAWRMGQWDLPVEVATDDVFPGHGVWSALRALCRETDAECVSQTVALSATQEVLKLQDLGWEAYAAARDICRNFLSFREIRDVQTRTGRRDLGEIAEGLQKRWSEQSAGDFDYIDTERVCAVRHAMVRMERERLRSDQIGDLSDERLRGVLNLETSILLQMSKMSRKHNNLQKAMSAVTLARHVRPTPERDEYDFAVRQEQASVLWAENSHTTALQALSVSIADVAHLSGETGWPQLPKQFALALAKLGSWTATAHAENAQVIQQRYFEQAILALNRAAAGAAEYGKTSYQYALFADAQYRQHATSPEHHRARRFVERRKEELELNEQEATRTRDPAHIEALKAHKRKTTRQLKADQAVLMSFEQTCAVFLERALTMYATCLRFSDKHDEVIFSFSSLWFENSSNTQANLGLQPHLDSIPSHKFIPLSHQFSARISPSGASPQAPSFTHNLTNLLQRMCADHPYHTMYAIYALIKAGSDFEASQHGRSSPSPSLSSQALRAKAAETIWLKVKSLAHLNQPITDLERVCAAYVEWAETSVRDMRQLWNGQQLRKSPHRLPAGSSLLKLKNVDVPVATKTLPIDISGTYEGTVKIQRYSEAFSTAGGLHLPKINECIGTDGKRYKQLFKHEDDLRQDAVIQQVFRLVNGLLTKDKRTRQRHLIVRGYIVLPLGPQCGLLEFVPNTKPLGEVLTGLHDKYKLEGDSTANDAKQQLVRAARGSQPAERIKAYKEAISRFPPAMRYHFLEQQMIPAAWQVMRLSYVRSVATTSIVGYILGMGDRHVSNILMDEASGEMVHIDFGIVFEQGKLLPVPELVPFRLTRDLVDGMGIFGVEGSFRRCCQETLRVMRAGAATIQTVLEVFKYDPLFEWMTNPIKLLKAQAMPDDETNATDVFRQQPGGRVPSIVTTSTGQNVTGGEQDTAELSADYAVSTVMSKLSSTLSVEHTVNDLIQQARDVNHLGAIYFGWSAHL